MVAFFHGRCPVMCTNHQVIGIFRLSDNHILKLVLLCYIAVIQPLQTLS